ncbi:hypothetical protein BDW74DRAFT_111899 [Aspergillus multicolor]|uniref:uncharacterized protein n=1 Tax=Aspergillus multicolor TaxID=41759 RepID=UPI003CCD5C94
MLSPCRRSPFSLWGIEIVDGSYDPGTTGYRAQITGHGLEKPRLSVRGAQVAFLRLTRRNGSPYGGYRVFVSILPLAVTRIAACAACERLGIAADHPDTTMTGHPKFAWQLHIGLLIFSSITGTAIIHFQKEHDLGLVLVSIVRPCIGIAKYHWSNLMGWLNVDERATIYSGCSNPCIRTIDMLDLGRPQHQTT